MNKGIDYGVKEHLFKQGREKKENSKIFRCEERPCDGRGSTFLLILFYETVWQKKKSNEKIKRHLRL